MKYKDIVDKLHHMPDDGYFNSHYSKETHGTGSFKQFSFYTIGTCECARCIAHALAFGMHGYYEEKMITEEIIEELKSIYGMKELINAVKEEQKAALLPFFAIGGTSNVDSEA
ncbi:MAG: hypothetical protein MRK01_04315 [Candidatus Scalindua sp.]|nr:hypothetical protein [Candidatus Scalindua sp.]